MGAPFSRTPHMIALWGSVVNSFFGKGRRKNSPKTKSQKAPKFNENSTQIQRKFSI
jgi:hypothetical protein